MVMTLVTSSLKKMIAPHGVLRAGINLSNVLLVSSRSSAGEPLGVAPDMARALSKILDVPIELVTYKNPGLLADAASCDEWDVAFIGAEPQRAQQIAFTSAYVEIQVTFLVPPGQLPSCLLRLPCTRFLPGASVFRNGHPHLSAFRLDDAIPF